MKQVPEALIGRLHPDAWGWALACCRGDRVEAEEVLQTTYVKVLDGRARFDGRASVKTWLFAVIRRTAAERRRGRRLLAGRVARWLQLTPATPAERRPDARLLADERDDALERALGRLSPRQREVLHLVFFQELTIEQAAEVLRVGTGSARTHYARGKRRLRELLEQDTTARGESGPGRVRIATDGR